MEDTLRDEDGKTSRLLQFVLILVVMEDTLRVGVFSHQRVWREVLILVVMEDTLRGIGWRYVITKQWTS